MRFIIVFLMLLMVQKLYSQTLEGSFFNKFEKNFQGFIPDSEKISIAHEIAWKGERLSFQVLLWDDGGASNLTFAVSDFTSDKGIIPKSSAQIRFPKFVKGDPEAKSCGAYSSRSGSYLIADALSTNQPTDIEAGEIVSIWITINVPRDVEAGDYKGKFSVVAPNKSIEFDFELGVLDLVLAQKSDWSFHLDLWQFPTAGLLHYNDVNPSAKIEAWSDAHFEFLLPSYQLLADAGQKAISAHIKHDALGDPSMITWILEANDTWDYDFTVFDKYVSALMAMGIDKQINCFSPVGWNESVIPYWDEAAEVMKNFDAPLGSDEYQIRWDHFLTAFKTHLEEKNWFDITVLYLDEVSDSKLTSVIQTVHDNDPAWKLGIAYSHHLSDSSKSSFYDLSGIIELASSEDIGEEKVSTFYTSCTQDFPNNYVTLESSSAEMTWMAYYSMAESFDGYLRWAFDNWKNTNPFDIRDGSNSAGDFAFIYRDSNVVPMGYYSSIRLEMLREGIEDFEKINQLRKLYEGSDNQFDKDVLKEIDDVLILFDLDHTEHIKTTVEEAQQRLTAIATEDFNYCKTGGLSESLFYFKNIEISSDFSEVFFTQSEYPEYGYVRLTDELLSVKSGSTILLTLEAEANLCFQSDIWMDLNFDKRLDQSEVLLSADNLTDCASDIQRFSLEIPSGLDAGFGTIRLRIAETSSNQTEACGTFESTSVVDIPFEMSALKVLSIDKISADPIRIFSNPADEQVSFTGIEAERVQVKVIDLQGVLVQEEYLSQNENGGFGFSIDRLSKGQYLLVIKTNNAKYSEKLLLE